jgi:hypothetical protein
MRGKILLLVVGIIFAVCGLLGLIESIAGAVMYANITGFAGKFIIAAAVSAVMIIFGILGILFRANAKRAKLVIYLGIIIIIYECVIFFMNLMNGTFQYLILSGIAIGILYVVGGNLNKPSENEKK